MKRVACVIIFWFTASLLIGGCSRDTKEEAEEKGILVNLDISVALSDVVHSMSRAGLADAVGDNEKMQTLRIIVVRENGVVEENRLITFAAVERYGYERFKVVGKEKKQIYLFVNEENEAIKVRRGSSAGTRDLDLGEYLSGIVQWKEFPKEEFSELTIRLDEASEQLAGALPMSECHEIEVSDTDSECDLFVTRAAVKFSFRITNKSSKDRELTGLTISKMSRYEYYLPHNAEYGEENIGDEVYKAIISYDDLSSAGEYDYNQQGLEVKLPMNKEVVLEKSVYLLEGKSDREYSVGIEIDGAGLENKVLEGLRKLPRNTHVVVNITLNDDKDNAMTCEVDVRPYSEKILKPEFGL